MGKEVGIRSTATATFIKVGLTIAQDGPGVKTPGEGGEKLYVYTNKVYCQMLNLYKFNKVTYYHFIRQK